MIGNIDSEDNLLAAGLCLRAGITPAGLNSYSFLTGHRLGFLMGFMHRQTDVSTLSQTAREAYGELLTRIRANDAPEKAL
jgi:hypothetical protein